MKNFHNYLPSLYYNFLNTTDITFAVVNVKNLLDIFISREIKFLSMFVYIIRREIIRLFVLCILLCLLCGFSTGYYLSYGSPGSTLYGSTFIRSTRLTTHIQAFYLFNLVGCRVTSSNHSIYLISVISPKIC